MAGLQVAKEVFWNEIDAEDVKKKGARNKDYVNQMMRKDRNLKNPLGV